MSYFANKMQNSNIKEPLLKFQESPPTLHERATYSPVKNDNINSYPSNIQPLQNHNLNSYLKSISYECDISGFYEVKQVFQRNEYCHVIGFVLEIISPEIQKLITESLLEDNMKSHTTMITQLFQIWTVNNGKGQKIYQKGLTSKQCVSDCSIHDNYAAFVIGKANPQHHYMNNDGASTSTHHHSNEGLVHVISLETKEEQTFDNVMDGAISAIFIDEMYLVLGCGNIINYMPLRQIFSDGMMSPQFRKQEHKIPDRQTTIYAFWRGKFEKHYEVYTVNKDNAGLRLYNFEPVGMQVTHSTSNRLRKTRSIAQSIQNVDSQGESGLSFIKHLNAGTGKEPHHSRPDHKLRVETQKHIQDLNALQSPQYKKANSFMVNNEDNFTTRVVPEITVQETESFKDDKLPGVAQASDSNKVFSSGEEPNENQNGHHDFFGDIKPLESQFKKKYRPTPLDKIMVESAEVDEDTYVRTKFYWRQTLAFRKSGQVDFVRSDGSVYSTKDLDFQSDSNLQNLLNQASDIQQKRQNNQLKVVDAFVNGQNIYLVDEENVVHCLNIDTLICSKTNLTPQEALILPYQEYLKIFSDFILYDNFVIVSHGPILSVCDLNETINSIPQWRHLYSSEKDVDHTNTYHDNLRMSINMKKRGANQKNSFEQCKGDIRMIKIREQENEVEPRLVILFHNNRIAVGIRNLKLQWEYEQNQEWNIQGIISDVIQSVKTTSLILFLHKDDENQKQNQLLLFYCTDKSNVQRMTILGNIEPDERVFAINISQMYMKDLTQNKPKIGIYNDSQRSIRIMQLEEDEEDSSEQYYGTMKQIHKIEKVKLHQSDVIRESGNPRFVYLARENKIFKFYVHEQALTETFEPFAEVQSNLNKDGAKQSIESFDILEGDQFVYASTHTQLFFNHQSQIHQQDSVISSSLTKTNHDIYCDDKYNRICTFSGPFTLQVFPHLHLNRISLMGIHHEAQPIFYQHKGEDVFVLTADSKIKTWSSLTGKLKSTFQLAHKYDNYKKMNERQGQTLVYKQDKADFFYHYLLLEITSECVMVEHALILSEHKSSLYINSHRNLFCRKDVTQKKRNSFEICSFNPISGQILERVKIVDQHCPINFLSPSFALYIDIDFSHSNIVIKETFTEKTLYVLPKNLRKSISTNSHSLIIEDIEDQIFFIEEDLLLIENLQNFEILYSISEEKELLLFNKLKSSHKFNNQYLPDVPDRVHSTLKGIKSIFQGQVQPNDFIESDISVVDEGENQWWDNQLKDLIFLNLKRYRDQKFMNNGTSGLLAWSLHEQNEMYESQGVLHLKLYTVMPFSYFIWKTIDEVSYKKGTNILDIENGLLFLMCFAILPHKNQTLMHKLAQKNNDGLKYILDLSKKSGSLSLDQPLPHLKDSDGKTPLHIAFELNIRRQVDLLITHLKDYPLDYCTAEVANLLPKLIESNYINRVGDYLDARMLIPEWTSHYQREQLVIKAETNGKNYASTSYWPSTSHNFEKTFFSPTANDVPVKLQLLDVPNLHLYGDTNSEEFLNSLVRSGDIEIFDRKPVKAIISYKWEEARRVIMLKLFLPFMIYLAFFNFYIEYIFDKQQGLELFGSKHNLVLAERISKCILIMFAVYFLVHEIKQIVRAAKGSSISSAIRDGGAVWSFVDGVPLLCNVISMVLDTFVGDNAYSARIQRPFYAFSTLLLWLKVFYFLRLFRNLGHLVRMVFFVIYQIRYYAVICLCFTLAMSNCFYVLSQNNKPEDRFITNYLDSLRFTFYLFMLRFEPEKLGEVDLALVWAVLVMSLILSGFILFNLNVAMMKSQYDQCDRKSEQNTYRVFAMMIIESYDLVSVQPSPAQLLSNSPFRSNGIDQVKGLQTKISYYGRNSQYLLVAQPDSEEFKPKMDENMQQLSELKEMIMKTNNAINKREDDVIEKIDSEIFNKMAEMEEKQNHMFQLLERRQLHLMKMVELLVNDKQRQNSP